MLIPKVNQMGIKSLVGKRMTRTVKFMGEDVVINKLSVSHVKEIQANAKQMENDEGDDSSFDLLKTIISSSVEGGSELTDDDFLNFPLDELSKLSNEILKHSGIDAAQQKGKSS
jgi:hypothetical protein